MLYYTYLQYKKQEPLFPELSLLIVGNNYCYRLGDNMLYYTYLQYKKQEPLFPELLLRLVKLTKIPVVGCEYCNRFV